MPVLRQTPFISGLLARAGERPRRARCSLRQPRRTWLYVACAEGVDENLRVKRFENVFVWRSWERIGDEAERNKEVLVGLLVRIVENCRTRKGCRTLIVDLGITTIRLRSIVREHKAVAMLVIE